ncbi:VOC family protein [Xanthobacter pseudotagetidis]|uniref:VOC family protein n=1 Tax=Xanthobacter pseudotagetidis TaxID=3119911 RepID=UPI003727711D
MEILKIGTINVAVSDAMAAGRLFSRLGLPARQADLVRLPERPAQINYLQSPVGESSLSFVEPSDPGSPVARFLERRGEGLFSLSIEVRGLKELMAAWRAAGVAWVLDEPMRFTAGPGRPEGGAANWTRPRTTLGMIIEVIERDTPDHGGTN